MFYGLIFAYDEVSESDINIINFMAWQGLLKDDQVLASAIWRLLGSPFFASHIHVYYQAFRMFLCILPFIIQYHNGQTEIESTH